MTDEIENFPNEPTMSLSRTILSKLWDFCRCIFGCLYKVFSFLLDKFHASGAGIYKYVVAINVVFLVVLVFFTLTENSRSLLNAGAISQTLRATFQPESLETDQNGTRLSDIVITNVNKIAQKNESTKGSVYNLDSVSLIHRGDILQDKIEKNGSDLNRLSSSFDDGIQEKIDENRNKTEKNRDRNQQIREDSGEATDDNDGDSDEYSPHGEDKDENGESEIRDLKMIADSIAKNDTQEENNGLSKVYVGPVRNYVDTSTGIHKSLRQRYKTRLRGMFKRKRRPFPRDNEQRDMIYKGNPAREGWRTLGQSKPSQDGDGRNGMSFESSYNMGRFGEAQNKYDFMDTDMNKEDEVTSTKYDREYDIGNPAMPNNQLYPSDNPSDAYRSSIQPNSDIKYILSWTPMYKKTIKWELDGTRFKRCAYRNCLFTADRSMASRSDAILFHMGYMAQEKSNPMIDHPSMRRPDQLWILTGSESPAYTNVNADYNGIFNATYTYRTDSDIFFPQGYTVKLTHPIEGVPDVNFAYGKRRIALWVASHCRSASKRESYVSELRQYIDVDVFGECGDKTCGHRHAASREEMEMCNRAWASTYKFALAFENSMCTDYITQVVWKPLHYGIVPVVRGAGDYARLLPPNSYIDVDRFASPRELAEYLVMLNSNSEKYNEYFAWRRTYGVSLKPTHFCNLCEYVNRPKERKVYDDMVAWWNRCQ